MLRVPVRCGALVAGPDAPGATLAPARLIAAQCAVRSFVGVVQVNNPRIFVGPVPASGTGSLKAWWKFFCNPKKQYEGDFGREGITNWFRLFIIPTGYYVWTDFPNRALWSLTMYKKGTWNDDSVKKEWCAPACASHAPRSVALNICVGAGRLFTMNGFNRATFCVAWMIYFGVFAPILISAIFLPFWRAGRGMTGGLSAAVQARYKNLLKVVLQYYSYFLVFWTLNLFMCTPPRHPLRSSRATSPTPSALSSSCPILGDRTDPVSHASQLPEQDDVAVMGLRQHLRRLGLALRRQLQHREEPPAVRAHPENALRPRLARRRDELPVHLLAEQDDQLLLKECEAAAVAQCAVAPRSSTRKQRVGCALVCVGR